MRSKFVEMIWKLLKLIYDVSDDVLTCFKSSRLDFEKFYFFQRFPLTSEFIVWIIRKIIQNYGNRLQLILFHGFEPEISWIKGVSGK